MGRLTGRLAGKTAIVTGAGSGIGRAISTAYAHEGAQVLAADKDLSAAEETANLAAGVGAVVPVETDVTNPDLVRAMVRSAIHAFGRVDVLVNNAAVQLHGQDGRCHEVPEDVWE